MNEGIYVRPLLLKPITRMLCVHVPKARLAVWLSGNALASINVVVLCQTMMIMIM